MGAVSEHALLDVIVIGAGPGGSSAAYHLARGGAKVALVDKRDSARPKVCAGALTALAQDCLIGMGLEEWLGKLTHCREVRIRGPWGSEARLAVLPGQRTVLFAPRSELDATLVRAAAAVGVRLFLGVEVSDVALDSESVRIDGSDELPPARLLILAEGSEAPLASRLGLVHDEPQFLGMQTVFQSDPAAVAEVLYLPHILPCASWAFPDGEGGVHLGMSVPFPDEADMPSKRQALWQELVKQHLDRCGPTTSSVGPPVSASIRVGLGSVQPYGDRMLLAGEAAGVAHPLTLHGIGPALESGRIVAQHALYALEKGRFSEGDLSAYAKALRRRFAVEYRAAWILRAMLHSEAVLERIVRRADRDPGFAFLIAGIFCGTQSALGTLTPANLARYLMWWRSPRRLLPWPWRRRGQ